MGYQSDKQLYLYNMDLARKIRQQKRESYQRNKPQYLVIARIVVVTLSVFVLTYLAVHYR
jgi:hypothetical protein